MSVRIQRVCPLAVIKQQGLSVLSYFSICGRRGVWFSCLVFSGPSDAVEDSADGAFSLLRAIRFIIGLDFAVTLSSFDSFCVRFDIISQQLIGLKWLILNKHNRWFHSSRVKFPSVSTSASWFLVSMYLIWNLGSKLIRSNNQSRATLWVRDTCLIVGFLLFMIILITASLSSNTYNKASGCEEWTFEGTRSTLSKSLITLWDCLRPWLVWGQTTGLSVLSWFWVEFQRTKTIRSHKSRAGIPSNLNLASKEMISDSVELWNWSLFLAHPTDWNKWMTSRKCGGVLFGQGAKFLSGSARACYPRHKGSRRCKAAWRAGI